MRFITTMIISLSLLSAGFLLIAVFNSEDDQLNADQVNPRKDLARHDKLQEQIEIVVAKLNESNVSPEQRMAAVGSLWDAAKDDEAFFAALFHYYCLQVENRSDTNTITAIMLTEYLRISKLAITRVCMQHLYAEDETIRRSARDFLQYIHESRRNDIPPDFSYYKSVIGRPEEEGPKSLLVSYMYEVSPSAALLRLIPTSSRQRHHFKHVLWSEHVVSDAIWMKRNKFDEKFSEAKPEAIAELQKLSAHEAWWVRQGNRILTYELSRTFCR